MAVRSGDMPMYRGHGATGYNRSRRMNPSSSLPVHSPQYSRVPIGRIGHAWKDHEEGLPFKIPLFVRRYLNLQTRMKISISIFLLVIGILCFQSWPPTPSRSRLMDSPRVINLSEIHQATSVSQPRDASSRTKFLQVAFPTRALDNYEEKFATVELEANVNHTPIVFDDETTGCPFIAEWQKQTAAKPTCNVQHEIGIQLGDPGLLHRLKPIDSGGFKDVW